MEVELEHLSRKMSVIKEGWKPGLPSPEVDHQLTISERSRPIRALKTLAGPIVISAARLIAPLMKRYARDPRYGDAVANAVAGILPELAIDRYFDLWQRHGVHLIPKEYDWPIPDTATLPNSLWNQRLQVPGLDLNPAAQLDLLTDIFLKYKPEYDEFPLAATSDPCQYHIDNGLYEAIDGEVLYCMIRHFRPRRIFEIGSGWSTLLAAQAVTRNQQEHGTTTELVSIEPFPKEILKRGFRGLSRLVVAKLEDLDLSLFDALEENDILFIDSSHVLRIGNDVYLEYLELLPRLRPGVLVHIHDVFLPCQYPREWIVDMHRFCTEQYVLQAFLAFNKAFEVLWASNYMHLAHSAELEAAFGSYNRATRRPGSFWIRRQT